MKKTFLTCMAVVALLAVASGAGAITCTIDQRPAATLLIPYFQATYNADATALTTGATALDTLVTIGNASSAPMIVHVTVWNDRSEVVLDFNLALTGFDIQSWSMGQILRGFLPQTPVNSLHVPQTKDPVPDIVPGTQVTINGNVCQSNPLSVVYPAGGGYLRVKPTITASPVDLTQASTVFPAGPFPNAFLFEVLDSLDTTKDTRTCLGGVDNVITNPIHGYVTIDHANYCTLTNPDDPLYWTNDAAGFENNLWGDYIFTNGAGLGTMGFPAVTIEATSCADFGGCTASLVAPGSLADNTAAPSNPASTTGPGKRTFYRRYVTTADAVPCINAMPAPQNAWDCGFGDQREALGLKYAARWFDATAVTSFFNVWRGSSGNEALFAAGLNHLFRPLSSGVFQCTAVEPNVTLAFYDEDENTVSTTCPVSPCPPEISFNFPLETQRTSIKGFTHPAWPAGWVSMEFYNSSGPLAGTLDQAYVTYDFQGATAFLSAGIVAAQLDPTNCQPLLVPVAPAAPGVTPSTPTIPVIVGTGP